MSKVVYSSSLKIVDLNPEFFKALSAALGEQVHFIVTAVDQPNNLQFLYAAYEPNQPDATCEPNQPDAARETYQPAFDQETAVSISAAVASNARFVQRYSADLTIECDGVRCCAYLTVDKSKVIDCWPQPQ